MQCLGQSFWRGEGVVVRLGMGLYGLRQAEKRARSVHMELQAELDTL